MNLLSLTPPYPNVWNNISNPTPTLGISQPVQWGHDLFNVKPANAPYETSTTLLEQSTGLVDFDRNWTVPLSQLGYYNHGQGFAFPTPYSNEPLDTLVHDISKSLGTYTKQRTLRDLPHDFGRAFSLGANYLIDTLSQGLLSVLNPFTNNILKVSQKVSKLEMGLINGTGSFIGAALLYNAANWLGAGNDYLFTTTELPNLSHWFLETDLGHKYFWTMSLAFVMTFPFNGLSATHDMAILRGLKSFAEKNFGENSIFFRGLSAFKEKLDHYPELKAEEVYNSSAGKIAIRNGLLEMLRIPLHHPFEPIPILGPIAEKLKKGSSDFAAIAASVLPSTYGARIPLLSHTHDLLKNTGNPHSNRLARTIPTTLGDFVSMASDFGFNSFYSAMGALCFANFVFEDVDPYTAMTKSILVTIPQIMAARILQADRQYTTREINAIRVLWGMMKGAIVSGLCSAEAISPTTATVAQIALGLTLVLQAGLITTGEDRSIKK